MGVAVGSAIAVAVVGSVGAAVGSSASTVVTWSAFGEGLAGDGVHPASTASIAITTSVAVVFEIGENTR